MLDPRRSIAHADLPVSQTRRILRLQAMFFRILMAIGMFFHRTASPTPKKPTFVRTIPTTVSPRQGLIWLCFYAPDGYSAHLEAPSPGSAQTPIIDPIGGSTVSKNSHGSYDSSHTDSESDTPLTPNGTRKRTLKRQGKLTRLLSHCQRLRKTRQHHEHFQNRKKYPVVLNFHGGGFTLGNPTDDCRWARQVVEQTGSVVVSVGYRLAPEHPFPTAVEDGVDAILWLAQHADEYDLDPHNIIISGFSSGGNLAFTVPIRLEHELRRQGLAGLISGKLSPTPAVSKSDTELPEDLVLKSAKTGVLDDSRLLTRSVTVSTTGTLTNSPWASATQLPSTATAPGAGMARRSMSLPQAAGSNLSTAALDVLPEHAIPPETSLHIRGIVSFYPSVNYTMTRAERRATCNRPEMNLPELFTRMFDDSYIGTANLFSHPEHNWLYNHPNISYIAPDNHPLVSTNPFLSPEAIRALANPYLSPAVARDDLLAKALPDKILILAAEWDMLEWETRKFAERLNQLPAAATTVADADDYCQCRNPLKAGSDRVYAEGEHSPSCLLDGQQSCSSVADEPQTKQVEYWCVPNQPHAWDKKPYFWGRELPVVEEWYGKACEEMETMYVRRQ